MSRPTWSSFSKPRTSLRCSSRLANRKLPPWKRNVANELSGSGKSYTIDHVAKHLLKDTGMDLDGAFDLVKLFINAGTANNWDSSRAIMVLRVCRDISFHTSLSTDIR